MCPANPFIRGARQPSAIHRTSAAWSGAHEDPIYGNTNMVDWKIVKKPMDPNDGSRFGRYGRSPCEDLVDNKFNHYVAQQNLYAAILEDDYGIPLSSMWLCQLHKTHDQFHVFEVPRLLDMARRMLNECASIPSLSGDVPGAGADDEVTQARAAEKHRENTDDKRDQIYRDATTLVGVQLQLQPVHHQTTSNPLIIDVAESTEPAPKKLKLDEAGPNSGGQQDEPAATETEAAATTARADANESEPWPNQIHLWISFQSALINATKT